MTPLIDKCQTGKDNIMMKRLTAFLLLFILISLGCNLSANGAADNGANLAGSSGEVQPTIAPLPTFIILPSPTATPVECKLPKLLTSNSGYITKVTLAKNTQPGTLAALDPTNVFPNNATVHAVVAMKNAPSHTEFKAVWHAHDLNGAADCNSKLDEYQTITNGTRNLDFMLKPESTLPAGTYWVEIYVNGTLDTVAHFSVK
jgi:hypothetical protein